jgi:TonB family protein
LRADETGRFTLGGLPPGDYLLEARIPGFATSQGSIALSAGQTLQRDIALQVGTISETVTVSGRAGDPDTGNAPRTTSAEYTAPACTASAAGGNIRPPLKLRDVRPRYSQDLRDAGIQGTVVLTGRISTDGLVKGLQVAAPVDAGLANAAIDAVSQWRFSPTLLDCVPLEIGITTRITFVRE